MRLLKFLFSLALILISGVSAADNYCAEHKTTYTDGSIGTKKYQDDMCFCHLYVNIEKNINAPGRFFTAPPHWSANSQGKYFPKSQKLLADIFKDKKECPSESEYQSFLANLSQEIIEVKQQDEVREQKERNEIDNILVLKRTFLQKYCQANPRVALTAIEAYSSRIQVSPDAIKLSRVNLNLKDAICNGVFYTPKGATTCELNFDESGVVTSWSHCQ